MSDTDLFTLTVQPSDYESARWRAFTRDTSINWSPRDEYNMMFLRACQQYANDMLQARGHLFLNEVLDQLGLPKLRLGQLLGWTRDGAKFVDFGSKFESNPDGNVLLQLNFEGVIYDKVEF